jgi:hypothetical protein
MVVFPQKNGLNTTGNQTSYNIMNPKDLWRHCLKSSAPNPGIIFFTAFIISKALSLSP